MRNSRRANKSLSNRTPMEPSSQLGHAHALAGVPFQPDQFSSALHQRNYERARLRVVEMRAAGLRVPLLTPTGCAPLNFLTWVQQYSGGCLVPAPGDRQADDDTLVIGPTLNRQGFPRPITTYCAR